MPKWQIAMCVLVILSSPSTSMAGDSVAHKNEACDAWIGKYMGNIPKSQNLIGDDERVVVIVGKRNVLVELQDSDGGAFDASSNAAQCTKLDFRSRLDSGFGGRGHMLIHAENGVTYMRLYGFVGGSGPNKSGYLPAESLKIGLKKVDKLPPPPRPKG